MLRPYIHGGLAAITFFSVACSSGSGYSSKPQRPTPISVLPPTSLPTKEPELIPIYTTNCVSKKFEPPQRYSPAAQDILVSRNKANPNTLMLFSLGALGSSISEYKICDVVDGKSSDPKEQRTAEEAIRTAFPSITNITDVVEN
jgi:hypothetical protein